MSHDVEGNRQHFCDLDPKVKLKGKKVYLRLLKLFGVPSTAALVLKLKKKSIFSLQVKHNHNGV